MADERLACCKEGKAVIADLNQIMTPTTYKVRLRGKDPRHWLWHAMLNSRFGVFDGA